MQILNLNGQWTLKQAGKKPTFNASVPGTVHTDLLEKCSGEVSWELTTVKGETLTRGTKNINILPGKNMRIHILKCGKEIKKYGIRNLMLWLNLSVGGKSVSNNFVSFAKPKHLDLVEPDIELRVTEEHRRTIITLTAAAPALWVWLQLDGIRTQFSDNFFHLPPGNTVSVEITPEHPLTPAEIKKTVKVKSLVYTYR